MDITAIIDALSAQNVSLSVNGEKLRVEHDSSIELSEQTWEELRRRKGEIIAYLLTTNQPTESIPQSFLDRPCYRCGGHNAVRRSDGRWICPCYFALVKENAKPRPPLSSIDLSEAARGLASTCSQCRNSAKWYGTGCVAYCDSCWHARTPDNERTHALWQQ